jgi:hypothetical protein
MIGRHTPVRPLFRSALTPVVSKILLTGVVQRRLPRALWGLDGQGVALCRRRKTLVSLLDHPRLVLEHG